MLYIIRQFHTLSQLEVGYNPIGPDGAKALSEVLKFHGNIQALKLGWCQVNEIHIYATLLVHISWILTM